MTSPGAPDQAPAARGAAPGRVKTKGLPTASAEFASSNHLRPGGASSSNLQRCPQRPRRARHATRGPPHRAPRHVRRCALRRPLAPKICVQSIRAKQKLNKQVARARVPDSLRFEVREVAGGTPGVCREVHSRTDTGLVLLLGARCGAGARWAAAAAMRAGGARGAAGRRAAACCSHARARAARLQCARRLVCACCASGEAGGCSRPAEVADGRARGPWQVLTRASTS